MPHGLGAGEVEVVAVDDAREADVEPLAGLDRGVVPEGREAVIDRLGIVAAAARTDEGVVEQAGLTGLREGQKVEYDLVPGRNGKSSAENLIAGD